MSNLTGLRGRRDVAVNWITSTTNAARQCIRRRGQPGTLSRSFLAGNRVRATGRAARGNGKAPMIFRKEPISRPRPDSVAATIVMLLRVSNRATRRSGAVPQLISPRANHAPAPNDCTGIRSSRACPAMTTRAIGPHHRLCRVTAENASLPVAPARSNRTPQFPNRPQVVSRKLQLPTDFT